MLKHSYNKDGCTTMASSILKHFCSLDGKEDSVLVLCIKCYEHGITKK